MDNTQKELISKVGCYGCLVYVVLFVFSAYIITSLGYPTIYTIFVIGFFVILWFLTMWGITAYKKKNDYFND